MKHSLLKTASALAFTAFLAAAMPGASFAATAVINVGTLEQLEASEVFKKALPAQQETMRNFVKNSIADPKNANAMFDGDIQLNVGPQYGPGGATASTNGQTLYLPDATSAQINQALKDVPPFNFAAEEQKQYAMQNAQYGSPVKDVDTGAVLASPTPAQAAAWDKKLHDNAYREAMKVQDAWQQQMSAVGLMASNKAGDEILSKQQARDAEWKAAANAALAQLTAAAQAKVIDQNSYDNLINKALEELYAARLYYTAEEHSSVPIPSPLSTPQAYALLSQIQSQKAYAAAHPDVCIATATSAGNPAACGIVTKRDSIDANGAYSAAQQAANPEPYLGKKVEIANSVIPPEGSVNTYSQVKGGAVYTIDSNGVVTDSKGKVMGAIDKAGNTYDANLKLVSDPNGNFISMITVGKIEPATKSPIQFTKATTNPVGVNIAGTGGSNDGGNTSGGGSGGSDSYPAIKQQNTYSAKDDQGEIVY